MKLNEPKQIIGHAPAADSRVDLFVSGEGKSKGRIEHIYTNGVTAFGAHPKLTMRFSRDGHQPTDGCTFYLQ